ncbi:HEPN domain-containing protein [Dysgonomonas alginatilytica]|uniref:HEPN domain-containing protein n=1 Tax=Dysgonomonas alginatilytica TaxID=1605892 RepID=A0A2V3PJX3_9BACT|nr:HEPN domain-containing protein [Dysgonomonas alginatilytica]PXV61123.1 HEPN domain-containing protein [Dysgonomonas alginatilytica]
MKKSIAYLPKSKQEDLIRLVMEINKRLPEAEMIILFGSYARNEYVDYDERVEFGIPTSFRSDYDIYVITSKISDNKAGIILDNIDALYYKEPDYQTPVNFINDDIKTINKALEEGRYFHTQIKQEGVILYDSGKFKLARRRKLKFDEIQRQAQEYFDEKYTKAQEHFRMSELAYKENFYQQAIFNLHQACENYYYAIRLSFTLRSNKQHNLTKLAASVKGHSADLAHVFPNNSVEEKRLFNLVKDAYIEARYNPKFLVTKEDIDALIPKVELLRDITKRICEVKIGEYANMG